MFNRMYSDFFDGFFGGGGWYVSSERPPVADTQPSVTAAIAQNRMRNAKGAFILVLNVKNSNVACKFHLEIFWSCIRFLSVLTGRITGMFFFAIAPPSLFRWYGCSYRVTIKLPVILTEIYTQEIIAR